MRHTAHTPSTPDGRFFLPKAGSYLPGEHLIQTWPLNNLVANTLDADEDGAMNRNISVQHPSPKCSVGQSFGGVKWQPIAAIGHEPFTLTRNSARGHGLTRLQPNCRHSPTPTAHNRIAQSTSKAKPLQFAQDSIPPCLHGSRRSRRLGHVG